MHFFTGGDFTLAAGQPILFHSLDEAQKVMDAVIGHPDYIFVGCDAPKHLHKESLRNPDGWKGYRVFRRSDKKDVGFQYMVSCVFGDECSK